MVSGAPFVILPPWGLKTGALTLGYKPALRNCWRTISLRTRK
jgi:hypothetical protein